MSFRELAELVDSHNHAANSKAICQLMERGLVALARAYPKGQRLANEYRLTFVQTGGAPATNDYLTWKRGDAGTRRKAPGQRGNFRASKTSTRTASRVSKTSTGEETSRFESLNGDDAKPPILAEVPVEDTATHIVNHLKGSPQSVCQSPSSTGGQSSAAPDPDDLRRRVTAILDHAARGSQGQLAALAQIRPAALSKFLNREGSLNEGARIRLTLALPKIVAAEELAA